jgi:hypothetical protein
VDEINQVRCMHNCGIQLQQNMRGLSAFLISTTIKQRSIVLRPGQDLDG